MENDSAQGMHYRGSTIMVPLGDALRKNYSDLFSRTALYTDGSNHLYSFGTKTRLCTRYLVPARAPRDVRI